MSVLSPNTTLPTPSRPSLARLAAVELRKMTDTRSGFWLLVIAVLATAAVVALGAFTDGRRNADLESLLTLALFPMGILLPIVGILGITAEFSQRTALQTFTWVPQRARVMLAKATAMVVIAVAGFVVSLAISALLALLAGGSLSLTGAMLGQGLLFAIINTILGLGFGMLFGSPAVAIVVFFAAPVVIGAVANLVAFLDDARDWLDTTVAWGPLAEFDAAGSDWTNVLLAVLVWVGIPVVIGWVLLRRREVS